MVGCIAETSWEGCNVDCTGGLGDVSGVDSGGYSDGGGMVGNGRDSRVVRVG